MRVMAVGPLAAPFGVWTSIRSPPPTTRYRVPGRSGYLGVNTTLPSAAAHSPAMAGRAAISASVPSATTTLRPLVESRPDTTTLPSATSAVGAAAANGAVISRTRAVRTTEKTREAGNGERGRVLPHMDP